jgi:hypothetical protein
MTSFYYINTRHKLYKQQNERERAWVQNADHYEDITNKTHLKHPLNLALKEEEEYSPYNVSMCVKLFITVPEL